MVVLRNKARYQRGHSVHYRGLKLATNTYVLSVLDVNICQFCYCLSDIKLIKHLGIKDSSEISHSGCGLVSY